MRFNVWQGARGVGAAAARIACLATLVGVSGCSGEVQVAPGSGPPTPWFVQRHRSSSIDAMNILLALDNSRSMAAKQRILAEAVRDLAAPLLDPPYPARTAVWIGTDEVVVDSTAPTPSFAGQSESFGVRKAVCRVPGSGEGLTITQTCKIGENCRLRRVS